MARRSRRSAYQPTTLRRLKIALEDRLRPPSGPGMSRLPEMVKLSAGEFVMGSPNDEPGRKPGRERQRRVRIERPFAMGKYLITRYQFGQFVAATGYRTEAQRNGADDDWRCLVFDFLAKPSPLLKTAARPHLQGTRQHPNHPVLYVSHDDAVAYCDWLRAETGRRYRLPTEAEWEYACRAGTRTAFHVGERLTSRDACFGQVPTVAVGSYAPNAFGLYDMHGNAFEWCSDLFREAPDAPSKPEWYTVRGGSWSMTTPSYCRAAHREGIRGPHLMVGFRVACDLGKKSSRRRGRSAP